jgi:hypothetical protein
MPPKQQAEGSAMTKATQKPKDKASVTPVVSDAAKPSESAKVAAAGKPKLALKPRKSAATNGAKLAAPGVATMPMGSQSTAKPRVKKAAIKSIFDPVND